MILTCPSCATGYFVPDDAIGSEGRKVRCKSCGNVWKAERADEPLELTVAPEEAPTAVTTEASDTHHLAGLPPEALAEAPAEDLPKAVRARAEQNRRLKRAAAHGVVWAGLASVFAGILAGAWLFRVEVVELWPRAAAAYAAIGTEVNTVGLDFEATSVRALANDPGKIVVSGALRNVRDREIVAPPVRIALLDAHGAEIGHQIVPVRAAPVLPGKLQGYAVVIPDPHARVATVAVRFETRANTPKKAPDKAEQGPPPATHDGSGHEGASHEPTQAPAADLGPRPAVGPDLSAPVVSAAPVDARPVAETPPGHH